MKPKIFSGYLSSAFYLTLLSVAFPLSAEEQKGVEIHLSEIELQEIFNNPKRSYVYIGREVSNIAEVMEELSKLDDNANSLIHGLLDHIRKGFAIGNYDAVAQALEEAELVLLKNGSALGEEKAAYITRSLNAIIEQVIEEKLNLDAEILSFLKDSAATEDLDRGCNPHTHGLRLLVIKEKIDVLGKAKFRKDVTFKDDVKFEDDVLFEDDVTIEGTLSVADETIGCDLTVGCNINMNNSTSALVGNVLKGGVQFIHNFGTNNTFVGVNSGNFAMTGVNDTAVGASALTSNTLGSFNTAIGTVALSSNTIGNDNTAVGSNALLANTTGDSNTAVGSFALASNVTGLSNVAVGSNALQFNTANSNTAVGANALSQNTIGLVNTATGYQALAANTTGDSNTGMGVLALGFNTIGSDNAAFGALAMNNNTTGNLNTAVGVSALAANTTGNNNTAIGQSSLSASTVGSNNIALGGLSGLSLTTGDNNIYVGNPGVAVESDTIRIGTLGTHTAAFMQGIFGSVVAIGGLPVEVDATGQLGTVVSSAEFKKDIQNMDISSEDMQKLRPVKFVYRNDKANTEHYGLIAEEVAQVFPELVVYDLEGKPYSVRYQVLPVMLLGEVQKLAARVAVLEARQ